MFSALTKCCSVPMPARRTAPTHDSDMPVAAPWTSLLPFTATAARPRMPAPMPATATPEMAAPMGMAAIAPSAAPAPSTYGLEIALEIEPAWPVITPTVPLTNPSAASAPAAANRPLESWSRPRASRVKFSPKSLPPLLPCLAASSARSFVFALTLV